MTLQKLSFLSLILVSMILATGCTGTGSPSSPVTEPLTITADSTGLRNPDVPVTLQPSASTATEAVTTPVTARIFNGEYHWAEYRINNTITLPPNPRYQWEYAARIERSYEVYNGTPAIHENVTVTGDDGEWIDGELVTTKNGFHATENTYYERSSKRFLGGIYTSSGAGRGNFSETVPEDAAYRGDHNWGWLLVSPFEDLNMSLSHDGTDPVTVPAGTYQNARKCTGYFHDLPRFPITFWVSEGIPVPVQYRINNPDLGGEDPVQTFELRNWG